MRKPSARIPCAPRGVRSEPGICMRDRVSRQSADRIAVILERGIPSSAHRYAQLLR
jgi:hypothetical protein